MDDGNRKKEVEHVQRKKVCFVVSNITARASSPYSRRVNA